MKLIILNSNSGGMRIIGKRGYEVMIYDVEITETLQKTVRVEAEDEGDALIAVRRLYYGEKLFCMQKIT